MKKKVKVITDPRVIKLMLEDTRRHILKLLRSREMTISQLSEILGKTPQTVYHHIEKLKEAGLVEVKRTEMKGNLVEKYYGRTADVFYINLYLGDEELRYLAKSRLKTKLEIFKILGYTFDEEELLNLMDRITEKEHSYTTKISKELEEKEEALKEFSNEDIIHAVDWLTMAELGKDGEALELLRKLGEILKKE